MAVNCGVSFGLCAVRITRIDANGNVIAGTNMYVTDKPISMAVNPNIDTGATFSVRNGCGCRLTSFKVQDVLNWFEFAFVEAALEPEMLAFLLGYDTIEDGADVVGFGLGDFPTCSDPEPSVALEFWTQHIVGNAQDATFPWFHHVYPRTIWQLGNNSFAEAIAEPTVNGFSRINTNWGDGPYGDGPPDGQDISIFGIWKTDVDPPTAECAAQPVTDVS